MNPRKGILFEFKRKRQPKHNIALLFLFLIQKEDNFNNLFTFTFKITNYYILKS